MSDYKIYPSLLDAYQSLVDSDIIWESYWGKSENPSKTPEEFRQEQYLGLIDKINRVPHASEAADRGTAYNELIDALIHGKSEAITYGVEIFKNRYKSFPVYWVRLLKTGDTYRFRKDDADHMAEYYNGAISQIYVEAEMATARGSVTLYGYVDELKACSIHDIKTTGQWTFGKFRSHAQHLVYPYCLRKMGVDISMFEYNIQVLDRYGMTTGEFTTEAYDFVPERDEQALRRKVEDFIDFLEDNRHLITDRKVFGGTNE